MYFCSFVYRIYICKQWRFFPLFNQMPAHMIVHWYRQLIFVPLFAGCFALFSKLLCLWRWTYFARSIFLIIVCTYIKKKCNMNCNFSHVFCYITFIPAWYSLNKNSWSETTWCSCLSILCFYFLYCAQLQASQVSIELMEKSNRLVELEDVLSTRDKEIKELHSKLHEVVCMLPMQHSCSMNIT